MRDFLAVIFCLVVVVGFTSAVEAAVGEDCEIYGGVGYNNCTFDSELADIEKSSSAVNVFGGLRKWDLMDKFAVGLEGEYLRFSESTDFSATSFAGTLTYRFPISFKVRDGDWKYRYQFIRKSNFELRGIGAVGLYLVKNNQNDILTPGVKTGLECDLPIRKKVVLTTRIAYKNTNISLADQELDFKGWEFSGLLKEKF